MKVFSWPEAVPKPTIDWTDPNLEGVSGKEDEYTKRLKEWLIGEGYTGKNTGRIAKFQIADGYALYMLAEASRRSVLVHLPYGDGYRFPYIERLRKKDILANIISCDRLERLFRAKDAERQAAQANAPDAGT